MPKLKHDKDEVKTSDVGSKPSDEASEAAPIKEAGMTEQEAQKLQADATRPDRLVEKPVEGPAYGTKRADGEIEGVTVNVDQFKQPGEGGEGETGDRKVQA